MERFIQEDLWEDFELQRKPQPHPMKVSISMRFLFIATEWNSSNGGISTLNRELCVALAKIGHEVSCLVPSASENDTDEAQQFRVNLLSAQNYPGLGNFRLCFPPYNATLEPDVIVGHAHITGPAALVLQSEYFEAAQRVHILHTIPSDIEWYKKRNDDAAKRGERKEDLEHEFCRDASLVVMIGSKIGRYWSTEISARDTNTPTHVLIPGVPKTGPIAEPQPRLVVLVIGRLEDFRLKGLDIAAAALGHVYENYPKLGSERPELLVRGAPEGESEAIRKKLYEYANRNDVNIRVRAYSPEGGRIINDLRSASVLLMPSRAEGFGLVAMEAIAAGVPVLVSQNSGVAEYLKEREQAGGRVIPVGDADFAKTTFDWGEAIARVLSNRRSAFSSARRLRKDLQIGRLYENAAKNLVVALQDSDGTDAQGQTIVLESFRELESATAEVVGLPQSGLRSLAENIAILVDLKQSSVADLALANDLQMQRNQFAHGLRPINSREVERFAQEAKLLASRLPTSELQRPELHQLINALDRQEPSKITSIFTDVRTGRFDYGLFDSAIKDLELREFSGDTGLRLAFSFADYLDNLLQTNENGRPSFPPRLPMETLRRIIEICAKSTSNKNLQKLATAHRMAFGALLVVFDIDNNVVPAFLREIRVNKQSGWGLLWHPHVHIIMQAWVLCDQNEIAQWARDVVSAGDSEKLIRLLACFVMPSAAYGWDSVFDCTLAESIFGARSLDDVIGDLPFRMHELRGSTVPLANKIQRLYASPKRLIGPEWGDVRWVRALSSEDDLDRRPVF